MEMKYSSNSDKARYNISYSAFIDRELVQKTFREKNTIRDRESSNGEAWERTKKKAHTTPQGGGAIDSQVTSSLPIYIGRDEMHLVAVRPRPSTCRTSAVTRVSIPIVKHGRVLYVRSSIPVTHPLPIHTHLTH